MVTTRLPATLDTASTHERTGSPSTSTVHAPHCPTPQPYFGPLTSSSSRSTHRSGISGSTSTSRGLALTLKRIIVLLSTHPRRRLINDPVLHCAVDKRRGRVLAVGGGAGELSEQADPRRHRLLRRRRQRHHRARDDARALE